MRKVVSVTFAVIAAAGLNAVPALADGPGVGPATVVSVGDSAISGEAGRWAGNTNGSPSQRRRARPDRVLRQPAGTARGDPRLPSLQGVGDRHRRRRASANLACSGARTYTQPFSSGSDFKPGLDFYDDGAGHIGQAKALQQYAATHNVKMVVALIGANDYGFADIVQQCVTDWLTSPSWWKNYCHDDSSMTSKFTAANVAAITTRVAERVPQPAHRDAQRRLRRRLVDAARADLLLAAAARRADPLLRRTASRARRSAAAASGTPTPTGPTTPSSRRSTTRCATPRRPAGCRTSQVFDAQNALVGHRLCENTDGLLEEQGLATWHSAGAADRSEWVSQIRTTTTLFGPYQLQEDAHPSYWGQLALRNCLRQAYNGGAPRGGTCTHTTTGLNALRRAEHEPRLTLDDERHPCGARIGNGRRASAVSACAVTHTGVWPLVRE